MATQSGEFTVEAGSCRGMHVLVVEARFYQDLADELLRGATGALDEAGATYDRVVVPGALEIPAAIAMALDHRPGRYDAFVALGTVVRGETTHYEIVSGESARGIMDLSVMRGAAIGNGILTVENEAQAWARARVSEMNKGAGAAVAALAMALLKRDMGD
jgi:6,7-dimethyl-8-ribityllumazine synthase